MAIDVYDQTIAVMSRALLNLDAIVSKAEAYAKERKIEPTVLVQARLYPDMLPFVAQIRIATDTAKGAAARLTGSELPKWADDEATFAEICAMMDTQHKESLRLLDDFLVAFPEVVQQKLSVVGTVPRTEEANRSGSAAGR